jgi:hypothetical protein
VGGGDVASWEGGFMEHYRINKVVKPDGAVVKTKDVLAPNDQKAVERAEHDPDCPVCEVYRAGKKVGSVT